MTEYKCLICGKKFDWDERDFYSEEMVEHFAEFHQDEIMNFFDET